jgi:hypothetical protein
MKKTTVLGMVAGALTVLASCSSDLDVAPNNSDGETTTVTFSLSIPQEIQSRSYNFSWCDYTDRLMYAIYDQATVEKIQAKAAAGDTGANAASTEELKPLQTALITTDDDGFDPLDITSFKVDLAAGKTYYAIFWADNSESPYTFNQQTMTVTMDYSKVDANQDSYDAFTACYKFTVTSTASHSVTLRRPFAQINFGTDDLDKLADAGLNISKSAFKVRPYQSLNLFSGEVGDQAEDYVTFNLTKMPAANKETFPVEGFEYVAMNYILAPTDKETTDFYLLVDDDDYELHCPNIPIQRNYRTNIYGSLFVRQNNFNVEIWPFYNEDDDDEILSYETWDGSVAETLKPDEDGVLHVYYGAQLARVFYLCNRGVQNYANNTIVLENNLDMGGFDWTPVGAYSVDGDTDFRGKFDGQGHTIKNFRINGSYPMAGIFGATHGATIENLVIEDATVYNSSNETNYTGILLAYGTNTNVSNITVKGDIKIEGNDFVGAIAGKMLGGSISNITIEANEGSYVLLDNALSDGSVGGVLGETQADGTLTVSDLTSNLNVIGHDCTTVDDAGATVPHAAHVGGIIGSSYNYGNFTNCKTTGDVTLYNVCKSDDKPNPFIMTIGGIVGSQAKDNGATFNNCKCKGNITVYNQGNDATSTAKKYNSNIGYIGWFHDSGTPYAPVNPIVVN